MALFTLRQDYGKDETKTEKLQMKWNSNIQSHESYLEFLN